MDNLDRLFTNVDRGARGGARGGFEPRKRAIMPMLSAAASLLAAELVFVMVTRSYSPSRTSAWFFETLMDAMPRGSPTTEGTS